MCVILTIVLDPAPARTPALPPPIGLPQKADWTGAPFELTVCDAPDRHPHYGVAGFVAHVSDPGVGARQRMRTGHYIAYVRCEEQWFELDDSKITALDAPPTSFPYLVFLVRTDGRRMLPGKQPHAGTPDAAMLALLQQRASVCAAAAASSSSGPPASKRPRVRDRSGQQQDRALRQQDRSGQQRDRSDRDDERLKRHWGSNNAGDNRDHTRSDAFNNLDDQYKRYAENWERRRAEPDVSVREFSQRAEPMLPQPCRLCPDTAFLKREDFLAHVDAEHGGLQRYRNALFSMLSLSPYVVKGQEWRAVQANFSEFFARSAMDWEYFTSEMEERLASPEGLAADHRWSPRGLQACVFCARRLWQEELYVVYLAGDWCFMQSPEKVAELLHWETYHEHWPDIPVEELKGSAVSLGVGAPDDEPLLLLHKRRVNERQRRGEDPAFVCEDCHDAFSLQKPRMCRFALANHLWLGRWQPLFRDANLSHQMLLALARIVTTKVVLRPEGNSTARTGAGAPSWDFLFHQSGMIGSAILFGNASCKQAMEIFPKDSCLGEFAVSFVGKLAPEKAAGASDDALSREGLDEAGQAAQLAAQRAVKGIAKLKVDRAEFDEQAAELLNTNVVYKGKTYAKDVVARWCPDKHVPAVPQMIVDSVVAVPHDPEAGGDDDPAGRVVASGPGEATAAGAAERADADVEAAKNARFISAFCPEDIPGADQSSACLEVAALQNQLEEVENATKRSIAAEVESAIEGGACLVDEAGRDRILQHCRDLRNSAAKLTTQGRQHKLQAELQKSAVGCRQPSDPPPCERLDPPHPGSKDAQSKTLAELACPSGRAPLSLWDWQIWSQARPTLWQVPYHMAVKINRSDPESNF